MKKAIALLSAAILCLTLSACTQSKKIELPFTAADVTMVEAYHYIVPAEAEKKLLTEQEEIAGLVRTLSEITLKNKKIEINAGKPVTSFRFHLNNGTSYNIIHCAHAVKSGTIRLTDDDTTWFTSADIGGLWDNGNADIVKADESELPKAE